MGFARQREEEKEENRLSEEAERSFDQLGSQGDEDEAITARDDGPDGAAAAQLGATYQIQDESPAPASTIVVPAIVPAT